MCKTSRSHGSPKSYYPRLLPTLVTTKVGLGLARGVACEREKLPQRYGRGLDFEKSGCGPHEPEKGGVEHFLVSSMQVHGPRDETYLPSWVKVAYQAANSWHKISNIRPCFGDR
jgi:hypothetical protein